MEPTRISKLDLEAEIALVTMHSKQENKFGEAESNIINSIIAHYEQNYVFKGKPIPQDLVERCRKYDSESKRLRISLSKKAVVLMNKPVEQHEYYLNPENFIKALREGRVTLSDSEDWKEAIYKLQSDPTEELKTEYSNLLKEAHYIHDTYLTFLKSRIKR